MRVASAAGRIDALTAGRLLLRSADATKRGLWRNRFLHLGLACTEGAVKHFGLDRAGRDTVDADALSSELQRSRLGEADESEITGKVNRRAGKADVVTDGRVIYDSTTGPERGGDLVLHRYQLAANVDV